MINMLIQSKATFKNNNNWKEKIHPFSLPDKQRKKIPKWDEYL